MFAAQPSNFKRAPVIFMMGLRIRFSALLTRLPYQGAIPNGVRNCVSATVFTGTLCASGSLVFLNSFAALGLFVTQFFIMRIVNTLVLVILCNVFFCAGFALAESTVSHPWMTVELIQSLCFPTLKTNFHEFVTYLSLPGYLIMKLEGNQSKGISSSKGAPVGALRVAAVSGAPLRPLRRSSTGVRSSIFS